MADRRGVVWCGVVAGGVTATWRDMGRCIPLKASYALAWASKSQKEKLTPTTLSSSFGPFAGMAWHIFSVLCDITIGLYNSQ